MAVSTNQNTDLHVVGSCQDGLILVKVRVVPVMVRLVTIEHGAVVQKIFERVSCYQSESRDQGTHGRQMMKLATLVTMKRVHCQGPALRGAEDDLGAAGAADTGNDS